MKPENKKFLEDNRPLWHTLRDAQYLRFPSGNTKNEMVRVMQEEFRPGYTNDIWCDTCVVEMVTTLYREFEKWEAAQVQIIGVPETAIESIEVGKEPEAVEPPSAKPIPVKANFPSHKNHRR